MTGPEAGAQSSLPPKLLQLLLRAVEGAPGAPQAGPCSLGLPPCPSRAGCEQLLSGPRLRQPGSASVIYFSVPSPSLTEEGQIRQPQWRGYAPPARGCVTTASPRGRAVSASWAGSSGGRPHPQETSSQRPAPLPLSEPSTQALAAQPPVRRLQVGAQVLIWGPRMDPRGGEHLHLRGQDAGASRLQPNV